MISETAAARLARLPHIKRARGFRLYAPQERRILDLYQDGGRAMLGHRPGKLIHDVKNVLERGVLSPFPSPERYRLKKVVAALLDQTMPRRIWDKRPTHEYVALYPTVEAAIEALGDGGAPVRPWDPVALVRDGEGAHGGSAGDGEGAHGGSAGDGEHPRRGNTPGPTGEATSGEAPRDVWFWRPELPEAVWARNGEPRPEAIIVLLPLPTAFSVVPVLFLEPIGHCITLLPEPSLRAATLVAHMSLRLESRPEPNLPGFRSTGPYISMVDADQIDEGTYEERFLRFLERDILLSPDRRYPCIYPRELSEGELKKLERAAREILGGQYGH